MIPTIIIAVITFISIALSILFFPHIKIGKIKLDTYWIIALIGATALLIFSLSPIKEVYAQLTAPNSVNPLKILILFFSMTLMSVLLDEFGLFRYLANKATKVAHSNQYVLFFSLYALISLLTIFTSNDIVILTLTPFICFFAKNTKINPLPYLIAEFAAANTWSLMFIIGNPTNIYLATSAGITFVPYLKTMILPTIASGLIEVAIIFVIFHNKLKEPLISEHYDYDIESKIDLIIGVIHMLTCLVFLIISSYINVEMWLVSLISASSMLICVFIMRIITKKHWNYLTDTFKKLPYQLIPFFLSMFVIVVGLNYQNISQKISELLGTHNIIWVYGYSSLVSSNVINNIPMSILYSNIITNLEGAAYLKATYATIIGSNIGAFLTPIGALAGIMFTGLLNKYEVDFSFIDFMKYGLIIALPTITIALGTLILVTR